MKNHFYPSCGVICTAIWMICGAALGQDNYKLGLDSQVNPTVPHGEVEHYTFTSTGIFPGTVRDYWVYVPKQYSPTKPACLLVVQDGGGYASTTGGYRVPVVLDNLIAKGEMPVTIAVMINPGVLPARSNNDLPRYNRSYEYDSTSGDYARFLDEELLPEVSKKWNLTSDPNGRAITGASSGGSCAFFAAWNRPDLFRRVYSMVGSFTSLHGGQTFPDLIRKFEPKPIKVFLQDGSNDQDIYAGSWPIANQDMYAALKFAGYDVKFEFGTGYHSGVHGGSIFPDAMRWLWKGYPDKIASNHKNGQPVTKIAIASESWKLLTRDAYKISSMASNVLGEVYFADSSRSAVMKINTTGQISRFKANTPGIESMFFGPDGRLYASQPGHRQVISIGPSGDEEVLARDVVATSIVINAKGFVFAANKNTGEIWLINKGKNKTLLDVDQPGISGLQFTPDQSLLIVSRNTGSHLQTCYQVAPDNTLRFRQPYYDLQLAYEKPLSNADGMGVDYNGWLYVVTNLGVQILDQAGRVNGILENPTSGETRLFSWGGGQNLDTIYVVSRKQIYSRRVQAHGALSHLGPIKPPGPRL